MYLLVAFNLLLDTMMGCSSGGVRVGNADGQGGTRMLHYRTLDWSMDPLREVGGSLRVFTSNLRGSITLLQLRPSIRALAVQDRWIVVLTKEADLCCPR